MARGAKKTFTNEQAQTFANANQAFNQGQQEGAGTYAGAQQAAGAGQNASQAADQYANLATLSGLGTEGQAANLYGQEAENPGYTPAEQAAMSQAAMGSLAGAFGAARSRLRDQTARTGNAAGYGATEEELARQQGQQQAQALGGLQKEFGQARISGAENAAGGLAGIGRSELAPGLDTGSRIGLGELSTGLDTGSRLATAGMQTGVGGEGNMVGTEENYLVKKPPSFWEQVAGKAIGALAGSVGA